MTRPWQPLASDAERSRARSEGAKRALRGRKGTRPTSDRAFASPLRYDESGFPITKRPPSLAERVRRLIAG